MRTVRQTIDALPSPPPAVPPLPAPPYAGPREDDWRARVGLAVESMKRHTSSEGWDLFAGLGHAGYALHGHAISPSLTDVPEILRRESPGVVVVQDQREWDGLTADRSRDPAMRFRGVEALAERPDVFRVGLLKDAHADPAYHRASLASFGAHAIVHYYHPEIVCRLAPYLRPQHLIRTWHSVEPADVPPYTPDGRDGCLLSGAVSGAYPLRTLLIRSLHHLPRTTYLQHPGYRADGCRTPAFLRTLSRFRVAICTSSRYGYALRKLIEATAAGCRVITDLPSDEALPGGIDGNLTRVSHHNSPAEIGAVVARLCVEYDPPAQREYAERAKAYFDWRAEGVRLASAIEAARRGYPS